jgi:hypothetical protein
MHTARTMFISLCVIGWLACGSDSVSQTYRPWGATGEGGSTGGAGTPLGGGGDAGGSGGFGGVPNSGGMAGTIGIGGMAGGTAGGAAIDAGGMAGGRGGAGGATADAGGMAGGRGGSGGATIDAGGMAGGRGGAGGATADAGVLGITLSNVRVLAAPDSATVSWSLDQPGTGQVEFGLSMALGSASTPETTFQYSAHVQTITNLTPGTRYYFRVKSANVAGQTVVSTIASFDTLGGGTGGSGGAGGSGGSTGGTFATSLIGLGNFISGNPGASTQSGMTTRSLGGWAPLHPSSGGYNANGTLLATHNSEVYRTSDGTQVGTVADNAQVKLKQWSNASPNKMYYVTETNCSVVHFGGATAQLFDLASARATYGINFDRFWATENEGSFIVGTDAAVVVFGIRGSEARALIWRFAGGWAPQTYLMPESYPSGGWDLYAATPIGDPAVPGNIGYVFVKPQTQGLSGASWAILSVSSNGVTGRVNADFGGTHHASQCVFQDADGSFRPGLVEASGRVVTGNGTSFSFNPPGFLWHLGWVRGTIYVVADRIESGNNVGAAAYALRRTNQGGYPLIGPGQLSNGIAYTGLYARDGITNIHFRAPNSNNVIMMSR